MLFNPFLGPWFRNVKWIRTCDFLTRKFDTANLINWGNGGNGINFERVEVLSDRMKLFVADPRGAICTARNRWIDLEPFQIFARAWFNASLEISTRPICRVCPNNCNNCKERIIGRAGKNNSGRVFLVAFTDNRYYGCWITRGLRVFDHLARVQFSPAYTNSRMRFNACKYSIRETIPPPNFSGINYNTVLYSNCVPCTLLTDENRVNHRLQYGQFRYTALYHGYNLTTLPDIVPLLISRKPPFVNPVPWTSLLSNRRWQV